MTELEYRLLAIEVTDVWRKENKIYKSCYFDDHIDLIEHIIKHRLNAEQLKKLQETKHLTHVFNKPDKLTVLAIDSDKRKIFLVNKNANSPFYIMFYQLSWFIRNKRGADRKLFIILDKVLRSCHN